MIELKDISKSFAGQELFCNGSFSVGPSEKIGLVGRNGYGKTTLFSLINGTLSLDSGSIVIPKNYRIGCLKQDIGFSRLSALEEVCTGLAPSEKDHSWKAEKVLHGLGFSEQDMQKPLPELSGGFQVRVSLAKALVSDANMLLLDEPNNYLDVIAIRWLIGFLRQWPGELMLITHDRSFMDSVVTHVVGIYRKKLRKIKGNTKHFYDQIAKEEEIYEKTRLRDEKKRRQTEIFISKFRAKARQAGLAQSRLKSIAKMEKKEKLEAIKTFSISFNSAEFGAANMMNVTNIGFGFNPQEGLLFKDLSFRIGRRERLCVIGKNGKGKSTLLRILASELKQTSGTIKSHPRLEIGYYSQARVDMLSSDRPILDEIRDSFPEAKPLAVRAVCGALLFSQDLALKPVSVLSGGEKSRVLLGKILLKPVHLLLLDEPTNHLDLESCEALCQAIDDFDGSVIMVTHNQMFLNRIAERLLVFDESGVSFFDGNYDEFLNNVGWQQEQEGLKIKKEKLRSSAPDRKAKKRLIAELRHEKSRTLKPLEKQIAELEAKISGLEAKLKQANKELLEASYGQRYEDIAALAKQTKQIPAEIDLEFEKLDKVFREYEEFKRGFAEKIGDLEEE